MRMLTKDEVSFVFKRTCEYGKVLKFEGFLASLSKVADIYYNNEFDPINENISPMQPEDKRILLLDFMRVDNPGSKLKSFANPFGPEKAGYRNPEDDIANKYRAKRPPKPVNARIEQWITKQ
jgi:hypothetical protein